MHKYHAQRTSVDGIVFASKAEAKRYAELLLLQKAHLIRELILQPRYTLSVGKEPIGEYVADFEYVDVATDRLVTEDVKGVLTPIYRWKKKHFQAQYHRVIFEIAA